MRMSRRRPTPPNHDPRLRRRLVGAVGLVVIAGLIAGLIGVYQKAFTDSVDIVVRADRAGLLLDPGSDVRAYGVSVGEVRSIRDTGDGVEIDVALDPDRAAMLPANVSSQIQATTVFGAKYVDLIPPASAATGTLDEGSVVQASETTVEVNDVFENALALIEAVPPRELARTLNAVASGLDGRGADLGFVIDSASVYLEEFNGSLPSLREDIDRSQRVLALYADVAPGLIDTAGNLVTTSRTLTSRERDLAASLRAVDRSATETEAFLAAVRDPLTRSLGALRPVTRLLEVMAPAITCSIVDLDKVQASLIQVQGADQPGIQMATGFLPAQEPYTYEENLPTFITGVGPVCQKMATAENPRPPHLEFPDGTQGVYDNSELPDLSAPPIRLYEEALRSFFGESGAAALLPGLLSPGQATGSGQGEKGTP